MSSLDLDTWIATSPERCFDLSLSIDAHIASIDPSRERAVAGVTSGLIGLGEEVTWEAKHFGIKWLFSSRITELDRPRSFVDEQVRGPFAFWHHRHTFEEQGGGTKMIDRVRYEVPVGVLGRLADRVLVNRYMMGLLVRRNLYLKSTLEGG